MKSFNCKKCGAYALTAQARQSYCAKCQTPTTARLRRALIHARDGSQCIYCSRTLAEHGIRLVVEHVVPRLPGDKNTVFGNLVTACNECNVKKNKNRLPVAEEQRILAIIHERNVEHGYDDSQSLLTVRDLDQVKRPAPATPLPVTEDTVPVPEYSSWGTKWISFK